MLVSSLLEENRFGGRASTKVELIIEEKQKSDVILHPLGARHHRVVYK